MRWPMRGTSTSSTRGTASEQLFDLSRDPDELHDLAGDAANGGVLREWRQRMIAHLAPRGDHWVRGGNLVAREDDPAYSPNYPK